MTARRAIASIACSSRWRRAPRWSSQFDVDARGARLHQHGPAAVRRRRRRALAAQLQRHVLQQHRHVPAPRLQPGAARSSIATSGASAGSATCRARRSSKTSRRAAAMGFPDADWINFETVVSTSADQIALAPGYLQREWTQGDRRYFHYKMDRPMLPFFCYLSARWEVKRGDWNGLPIEIYYDAKHPYNVDRMIEATQQVARLLHGELLAVPAPAGAHPRVPALRALRAELRQHDPVLGVDRLHRRPARSRQTSTTCSTSPRTRSRTSGGRTR